MDDLRRRFLGRPLKAFRSLIDAAYDYAASHPEIDKVVISGRSLSDAVG